MYQPPSDAPVICQYFISKQLFADEADTTRKGVSLPGGSVAQSQLPAVLWMPQLLARVSKLQPLLPPFALPSMIRPA